MAVCLVIPAPTGGGGVAPSNTWPLLGADAFLSAAIAPTAETASTAKRGGANTGHLDGNLTGPSSTDFQEFVQRRKSSGGRVLLDLRPQVGGLRFVDLPRSENFMCANLDYRFGESTVTELPLIVNVTVSLSFAVRETFFGGIWSGQLPSRRMSWSPGCWSFRRPSRSQ